MRAIEKTCLPSMEFIKFPVVIKTTKTDTPIIFVIKRILVTMLQLQRREFTETTENKIEKVGVKKRIIVYIPNNIWIVG